MNCPKCNLECTGKEKFCTHCGAELNAFNEKNTCDSSEKKSKCPKCGSEIPGNSNFCMNCGTAVGDKKLCPFCNKMIPINADACPQCGTLLKKTEGAAPEKISIPADAMEVIGVGGFFTKCTGFLTLENGELSYTPVFDSRVSERKKKKILAYAYKIPCSDVATTQFDAYGQLLLYKLWLRTGNFFVYGVGKSNSDVKKFDCFLRQNL